MASSKTHAARDAPVLEHRRGHRWPTAATLIVGVVLSFAILAVERRDRLNTVELELRARVDQRHRAIESAMRDYEEMLTAIALYVEGSHGRQTERQFAEIADALIPTHPGTEALHFAPRVVDRDRAAFEATRRYGVRTGSISDRDTTGALRVAPTRAEYYPFAQIEPFIGGEALLGLDISALRRVVVTAAIDSEHLASTGPITLAQSDARGHLSVAIAAPVYDDARRHTTIAERRAAVIGVAVAAFRFDDLFAATVGRTAPLGVDEYLFFGARARADHLVYVHPSRIRRQPRAPAFNSAVAAKGIPATFQFGDQSWTMVSVPLASVYGKTWVLRDWATLAAGLLLTFVSAAYLAVVRRRGEASRAAAAVLAAEVDRRTHTEQALARTVDRISRQQRAAAELAPAEELLSGDIEGLARKITEQAADAIGCERVSIWLFDETETVLRCVDHYARSTGAHTAGMELHESEYSNEFAALRHVKFVDANDALTDPRTAGYVDTYLRPLHITSMLDTVIDVAGRRLGLLCFEHVDTPHLWTPDEISFAGQLADKLGLALMSRLRRQSEEASRESDRRFRTIFNSVSDAILTHECETGAIIDVNDRACDLFGYSRDELLAGDIGMLSSGREGYTQAGALARIAATASAEPSLFEWQCKTRQGRAFWGEVSLRRVRFGERHMVLATVRDIDERKQAERKLQLANSLLASEIESAPDGVLVVATDPVRASYNRKFGAMWGLPASAADDADPDTVLATVTDGLADPAAFRAEVARFRHQTGVPIHRELELRDGRVLECHSAAMQAAPGSPLGRISFFRDITARRRAEEGLAYANTLLKTAMETSQDAILVVDPEGRIASFNDRFVEMWHLSRAMADAGDDAPVLAAVTAQVRNPAQFVARIKDLYAHPRTQANDEIFTVDGRVIERHSAGLMVGEDRSLGRVWFFRDVTEARHAAASLREERDFVAALLANLPALFALIDEAGRVIRWNENLVRLLGAVDERPWNLDLVSVIDKRDRATVRTAIQRAYRVGHAAVEFNIIARDGHQRTIQGSGHVINREGRSYLLAVGVDVTEARNAERSLRESEQRFRAVSETALDAIVMVGKEGCVRYWNRAAERILGYSATEAAEQHINEWLRLRPFDETSDGAAQTQPFLSEGLVAGTTLELVATRKDGVEIPIELALNPMALGDERHAVGVLRDITERKRSEAEIARLARYDALTGLPNRRVFVEALQQAIARVERGGPAFAVLYLDLDHFKDVNDTLGHPVGDRLLQAVAQRLQSTIRDTDTVARFGGDEFALIEADIKEAMDAAALAGKLISSVNEPLTVDGNEIRTATSVGIAIYGADSVDAEMLLSHADVALYRAKAEGRGTYRFFTDAMDTEVRARVQVAGELREALANRQLFLVYQPQVELATGRIIGLEALVRWRHPKRGIVGPTEFVPIAERTGLIVPLGRWVLREACAQSRAWASAGIAPPLVAVNVSGQQFKTPLELEESLDAILAETGLPASQLELEITESVLMEASRDHNDVLVKLREKGVRIAIDDFGNGYSSLDYLRRFHVDRIKIAQNFVADLSATSGSAPIVKAALGLARELGIEVVVEGVETAEQIALLEAWGSRSVQGHYFSPPLAPDLIAPFLRAGTIASTGAARPYSCANLDHVARLPALRPN